MKKWSEIKQATLNKLFLDETEARQQGYLEKFQYLANECLNIIANGVKPRIAKHQFRVVNKVIHGIDFQVVDGTVEYKDSLGNKTYVEASGNIIYVDRGVRLIYSNGELKEITTEDNIYGESDDILFPEDFLSFADVVNYVGGRPDPKIIYITDKIIRGGEPGDFTIFYNALWHNVTAEDIVDDLPLEIDASVLNCLPTYMASQLLAQDDVQRSTILKNEFELMLARLDTNIMYETNHYKSNGGWY